MEKIRDLLDGESKNGYCYLLWLSVLFLPIIAQSLLSPSIGCHHY